MTPVTGDLDVGAIETALDQPADFVRLHFIHPG
jgi:hypothetical protein